MHIISPMGNVDAKFFTPPEIEAFPRLSDRADKAFAKLPGLAALERYYQLDDALDDAIYNLQSATHRNAMAQSLRDVGLSEYQLLLVKDEAEALCEYAAVTVRKGGRTALERALTKRSTPGPDTGVGKILRAMTEGRYHVGWIARVKRGVGVVLFDLIRAQCVPITCPELAGRESGGGRLALRTMEVDGFTMSTGAPLFLFGETLTEAMEGLNQDNDALEAGVIQGYDPTPEDQARIERLILTSHYKHLLG